MSRFVILAFFIASGLSLETQSPAQTGPNSEHDKALAASASVASVCDIGEGSIGALPSGAADFGHHLALASSTTGEETSLDTTTALTARCRVGTTPVVVFDCGENAHGSERLLRGPGGALVSYELRRGSASAPLWDYQP